VFGDSKPIPALEFSRRLQRQRQRQR